MMYPFYVFNIYAAISMNKDSELLCNGYVLVERNSVRDRCVLVLRDILNSLLIN